jgi:hypothetical protein
VDEERAAQAIDHLQAAALELIEAARAFLDVVEEVVSDRDRLSDLADSVGEVAAAAERLVRNGSVPPTASPATPVENIPVS